MSTETQERREIHKQYTLVHIDIETSLNPPNQTQQIPRINQVKILGETVETLLVRNQQSSRTPVQAWRTSYRLPLRTGRLSPDK